MPANGPVSVQHEDGIAWILVDNPPVNATTTQVRAGLMQALEHIKGAKAAVLFCSGKTFIAGGDISEFDRPAEAPHLPDVVQAFEDSPVPVLASMHGHVLGGGFEIAMACAWRIAAPETRFGLPEVSIGLIPGAGGSQRLVRLVGFGPAIEIACKGSRPDAQEMLELQAIDAIIDAEPTEAARHFLKQNPKRPIPISKRKTPVLEPDLIASAEEELKRKAKGQNAPLENLKALCWSALPFEEGQKKERERHLQLRQSEESRALRHIFFAERAAAKPKAIANVTAKKITKVAIVGGGLMGAGIAASCLGAGMRVHMLETDEKAAISGKQRVTGLLEGALKRSKITKQSLESQLAAFSTGANYTQAHNCHMAIEAVFEDLEIKRAVFQQLAESLQPDAILATNTSYLDPEEIFEGIANPGRCLGLHFFSPAHIMRLVEVVGTPQTGNATLATGFALAKRLRKAPVLTGVCDGFIGNRMLAAYRREADYLLADGALPHEVDAAMREFGMPMGPYELQDLTGLQIAWANRKRQAVTRRSEERYVPIADKLCEAGRFGQRTGLGWYRYKERSRAPLRDAEVEKLIVAFSVSAGIARRQFSSEEITARLLAVLVNEGARIVEEGIAEKDSDIDVVQVLGYGFPKWRGGPMYYAKRLGLESVEKQMRAVMLQSPDSWEISGLLSGKGRS